MNLNPFKKEEYSLEKMNKAQQEINELDHSRYANHPPDHINNSFRNSFLNSHEKMTIFWKEISRKIKSQQKIIDRQFELGRKEAIGLNEEYDRVNEQTIDILLDSIKFRMEKLGQTKEESIIGMSHLMESIINEMKKE
ncbi:MAG: hypothetical protein KBC98_01710 [Candidatus Pacebacteria bacterium]|nr:hypothetical protein [Candidatus Paceibacterota bacterium]